MCSVVACLLVDVQTSQGKQDVFLTNKTTLEHILSDLAISALYFIVV